MNLIKRKFALLPHCYLVKGAKRGAIYNLKTKDVYSIDARSLFLLESLEKGKTLKSALISIPELDSEEMFVYLRNLEILKLGKFISDDETIIKIQFKKPPENLHFIWFEVTASCNLKCIHCYASSNQDNILKEVMTQKDWERVIEESYALGCRRLQFIGGEPLCIGGDNLLGLIQKAKNVGYDFIEVYTNCIMMNKKILEFFWKNKIAIATSIYGSNAKVHDLITQQSGSFDKTIETIKEIVKLKLSLRVGIIEMRQNTENIKETVKFLRRIGVQRIKIDTVRPSGRGCSQDLLDSNLINKQKRKAPLFSKCSLTDFQKAHYGHNCFSDKICITANGNILPCIMERNIVLGNILQAPLHEIIYSEKSKKIRNVIKDDIESCRDCEYRYCCFDCRVKAENFYDKPLNCLYNPYTGRWLEHKEEALI
jgi:radical SAM protein with 4Fe4S-binding SPASM domain